MVKMLSEDVSDYVLLEKENGARFRFKRNPQSINFGIIYYSTNYPSGKSLGTVSNSQIENTTQRDQIQKTIENLHETAGGEQDFVRRCKSIYGKRLRTETFDEKLTLDELEKVREFLNDLRNGDDL